VGSYNSSRQTQLVSRVTIKKPEDYITVLTKQSNWIKIKEMGVEAFPVLGVHPAEISMLIDIWSFKKLWDNEERTRDCFRLCGKGLAVGIKSGRPHYPVTAEVWATSNEIWSMLFARKEQDCAVQLIRNVGEPDFRT